MSGAGLVRIATRKSALALWQAEHVARRLRETHPGLHIELVPITTQGDRILDRTLAAIGGKGLFIKELEAALRDMQADIAVHSMKDVPAQLPPGFKIATVLTRADARDALVTHGPARRIADLPAGARIGTASLRRQAQLYALRRDLKIEPLRGNVDTRLKKLEGEGFDAILLAAAGLVRLGLESRISARLDPAECLPAVGQGVVGIECRTDDATTQALLKPLEDEPTRTVISAERAFAERLGGSCQSPIAAHAQLIDGQLRLEGLIAEPDGSRVLRDQVSGTPEQATALGVALADRLLAHGAAEVLERLRHS